MKELILVIKLMSSYDFATLKAATTLFGTNLLVSKSTTGVYDLLSPDCKLSWNQDTNVGISHCMKKLLDFQRIISKFERENCALRRGLKVNEKAEKTRMLFMPLAGSMDFRMGLILHWENGIIIHVTVVENPWQGFLDELTASDENRKLNQRSTNNMKKSVGESHHYWRRISDVVVDACLMGNVDAEENETDNDNGHTVVRLRDVDNKTTKSTEKHDTMFCESGGNDETATRDNGSNELPHTVQKNVESPKDDNVFFTTMSHDEGLFNAGSFMDDIEIDLDIGNSSKGKPKFSDTKINISEDSFRFDSKSQCVDCLSTQKKKIRFDTTVSALLIAERCEILHLDLFYNNKDLKAFQGDYNKEINSIQRKHNVSLDVAVKIYHSDVNSPEDIQRIKKENYGKSFQFPRMNSAHIENTSDSGWYPGKNLPIVRLVKAYKKHQKKKSEEEENDRRISLSFSTGSFDDHPFEDIEGRITEIRASSFGSSLRGRDPEATKYVITVKVLYCANLHIRNPSFNKFRTMNNSVRVQVGDEAFETPVVCDSNPIFSDGSTFLFSVSLEEATHGTVDFTIYTTALKKNVLGALRIPLVAIRTSHNSSNPNRIVAPILTSKPNLTSIGKGFYCVNRDDGGFVEKAFREEVLDEDSSFLRYMYKTNRLVQASASYDINKIPRLYAEITKVDVSNHT